MTVKDLVEMLIGFQDRAPVIFETRDLTPMGLPCWTEATVREECDLKDEPTGRVVVRLDGLIE